MPLFNLFKNCTYYWTFAALVAYFANHPLYTPPAPKYVRAGIAIFAVWTGALGVDSNKRRCLSF
jgi:very-long-chain enoyl-CoA reductase